MFPHLTELLSFPVHGLDPILFHTVSARRYLFVRKSCSRFRSIIPRSSFSTLAQMVGIRKNAAFHLRLYQLPTRQHVDLIFMELTQCFLIFVRSCFFRIAIKLLSFPVINLESIDCFFLINSEYILLITIISISYFTRNHKHEIDNCSYNNSTKFDIIV